MTVTEFWVTYHIASRANKQPTAQLVELEFQNHKLLDLEDVLDHVFRQGFVEAKFRPVTWFETKDGKKIKSVMIVEDLVKEGLGHTPETAIKVVIADLIPHIWFTYVYLHGNKEAKVTQRIKLETLPRRPEFLAHVTNHIFAQGYLLPKYRSVVRWETPCGKPLTESTCVNTILAVAQGDCEINALRLIIDNAPCATPVPHHDTPCRLPSPHHDTPCGLPSPHRDHPYDHFPHHDVPHHDHFPHRHFEHSRGHCHF